MSTSTDHQKKILVLRTSDNEEFEIEEAAAIQSATIRAMVEDDCASAVIPLLNVDSKTLIDIIDYLRKHTDGGDYSKASNEEKMKLDEEICEGKSLNDIFAIIKAANYLEINGLLDKCFQKVADSIKNKSVEYVRKLFNITSDYTPEEEAEIRSEYAWAFEGVDPDNE